MKTGEKYEKTVLAISLCLVMIASLVGTVSAITNNYVNDFDHPYVGMIAFYDSNGEFIWRCSGSLISPTKMVTAGHCADTAEGAVTARVWFQQDAGSHLDSVLGYDPVTGYAISALLVLKVLPARQLLISTITASPILPASRTRMTWAW